MAAKGPQITSVAAPARGGINYERLYAYRFRHVDQDSRQAVWREIARYVHRRMGAPERVLDPAAGRGGFITAVTAGGGWGGDPGRPGAPGPAAGRGEFITAVPAAERWGVDLVGHGVPDSAGVKMIISDIMDAGLPDRYF